MIGIRPPSVRSMQVIWSYQVGLPHLSMHLLLPKLWTYPYQMLQKPSEPSRSPPSHANGNDSSAKLGVRTSKTIFEKGLSTKKTRSPTNTVLSPTNHPTSSDTFSTSNTLY